MFRPLVKNMLLAGLLTVAVWTLFIFYWRTNVHMPSASDVFVSLVMMPVGLIFTVFLVRKVAVPLLTPKELLNQTEEINSVSQSGGQEQARQEREWVLPILVGNVVTMHGHSVNDLAEALSAKNSNFELDPDLIDLNGYPILSGRISDLDESEAFSLFRQWESETVKEEPWEQEDKRTIALAHSVFTGLIEEVLSHVEMLQSEVDDKNGTNRQEWPVVNLFNQWPSHWTESQKESVSQWFVYLLTEFGWPSEKVVLNPMNEISGHGGMALLDWLNVQVHRQNIRGFHILLASQSFIGEKNIENWLASGQLRTSQNQNGRIPGEAAAGLLLSDMELASKYSTTPAAQLHRFSQRKRGKSADDPGKISPEVLVETIRDALAVAHINPDEIETIAADTDDRAKRVGELMESVNEVLPDFDLDAGCFRLEADCGCTGVASWLTTLVLGWHQSIEHEQPVLCIYNNDSFERTALVINTKQEASLEGASA